MAQHGGEATEGGVPMPGARAARVEMTRAHRRRLLLAATLVGIAGAAFVGLYPTKETHRAQTTVTVANSDRPPATLRVGPRDIGRPGTLSRLTERAAAGEPLAVLVVSEGETRGAARSLLDGATELVRSALETGTRPTARGIAQMEAEVTTAQGAVDDAAERTRVADAALAEWRAARGPGDPATMLDDVERQLTQRRAEREAATAAGADITALEREIAELQEQRFSLASAQTQFGELQERRVAAGRAVDRANDALDAAQANLARLESGSTASISVGPREERTVVAGRGFGRTVLAAALLGGALLLGLVAGLTRSRPRRATEPATDASAVDADEVPPRSERPFVTVKLRDVVDLRVPDPEPEPPAHVAVPAKVPKRR